MARTDEPAILGPFAKALVDFAMLQADEWVIDVGCGTGAAAQYAAEAVGNSGRVTGVDVYKINGQAQIPFKSHLIMGRK